MTSGDRCSYWQPAYPAGSTRLDATWVTDIGDGTSRLSVLLTSGDRTVVEAPQCDPRDPHGGALVDRACVVSPCAGPCRVSRLPSYVATSATRKEQHAMFSTILLSLALAFGWGTEAAVGWGTETPAVSR